MGFAGGQAGLGAGDRACDLEAAPRGARRGLGAGGRAGDLEAGGWARESVPWGIPSWAVFLGWKFFTSIGAKIFLIRNTWEKTGFLISNLILYLLMLMKI